jgi:hypothetical protein
MIEIEKNYFFFAYIFLAFSFHVIFFLFSFCRIDVHSCYVLMFTHYLIQ